MGHSFKFIHCSDLHLGCTFSGLSHIDKELGKKMKDSIFSALDKIISTAKKESVDFAIFSGDIFDSTNETPSTRMRFVDALASLKIPCYVAYGNHDVKRKWEDTIKFSDNVFIFPEEVTHAIYEKNGVKMAEIVGASFSSRNPNDDLTKYADKKSQLFSIGVFHCNVNGMSEKDNYAPCNLTSLINSKIDYWALGHIHKRSVLHEYPHVIYSGNTQGLDHKESDEKGAYIVSVVNDRVNDMTFFKTGPIVWKDVEINITGKTDVKELFNGMKFDRSSILSVTFTGRGILDGVLRLENNDIKTLVMNQTGCTVSDIKIRTTPDIDLDAREDVGDFTSAVLSYRKRLKTMNREELLDRICSTGATQTIRGDFEQFTDEELREIIDDSTYLIIEKIMEVKS